MLAQAGRPRSDGFPDLYAMWLESPFCSIRFAPSISPSMRYTGIRSIFVCLQGHWAWGELSSQTQRGQYKRPATHPKSIQR